MDTGLFLTISFIVRLCVLVRDLIQLHKLSCKMNDRKRIDDTVVESRQ